MDFHAMQPEVMSTEMAEDVMEASFARGLAAAECFEVSHVKCVGAPVRLAGTYDVSLAVAHISHLAA